MQRRATVFAASAAAGAAVMYFFDPQSGRRRRAVTADQIRAMLRRRAEEAGRRGRYMAGKRHGVTHAIKGEQRKDHNDVTLQHKIESEVLRHYPKGQVNVNVEYGVAVLRGILDHPRDINRLIDEVAALPGIQEVRSLLHLPNTAAPTEATSTL